MSRRLAAVMVAAGNVPPRSGSETRHLSVIPGGKPEDSAPLTRAQVASRLGISISTVRRFEGERLHPQIGPEDVRLFDAGEVAALAAELANEPRARRLRNAAADRRYGSPPENDARVSQDRRPDRLP